MLIVRRVTLEDAASLYLLFKTLHAENQFLLYGDKEWQGSVQSITAYLSSLLHDERSMIFVANAAPHHLVGLVGGHVSRAARMSHVMSVHIGVLSAYQKSGVGLRLGQALLDYAKQIHIERIEATVICENVASFYFCLKWGFQLEGIKRGAIKINNRYYHEMMFGLQLT